MAILLIPYIPIGVVDDISHLGMLGFILKLFLKYIKSPTGIVSSPITRELSILLAGHVMFLIIVVKMCFLLGNTLPPRISTYPISTYPISPNTFSMILFTDRQ